MNRADFQKLAVLRIKEAKVLLDGRHYEGAYYLAGYAVECALKACIARKTKRHDFPPNEKAVRELYTHDLEKLVKGADLGAALQAREFGRELQSELGYRQRLERAGPLRTRYRRKEGARSLLGHRGYEARSLIMAEEVLVKELLSSEEVEAGEELLRRLDAARQEVIAAYWIFNPEVGAWRLEFVSPLAESKGPRWFYRQILDALEYEPKLSPRLSFGVINIEGPNYTFYKQLVSVVKSRKALYGVRLDRVLVGGQLVDLYIYRMPARA